MDQRHWLRKKRLHVRNIFSYSRSSLNDFSLVLAGTKYQTDKLVLLVKNRFQHLFKRENSYRRPIVVDQTKNFSRTN